MLLDEARVIHDRLTLMESASTSVEEAAALSEKANELATLAARVQTLSRRNRLLRERGVPLSARQGTDNAQQVVNRLNERFAELPKSNTLVDGQRWSRLTAALGEFSTSTETLQKQDWMNYFASRLFAGVPPDQRKQTILQNLPENRSALEIYIRLYQQFIQYRNSVPGSAEEFELVQRCSDQLGAVRFVENDDVPSTVKAFFDATSSGSGASLELLKAEVVDWLRSNNMLANYVVRAR
jgi:hypothetical protein